MEIFLLFNQTITQFCLKSSTMKHDPANGIQDTQFFGEYGGVNPSITDSSTFTFMSARSMEELFEIEREGCYLYSRHTNPSNGYLGKALASLEGTEAAHVAGSGMGSISSVIMQLCNAGDEIVSARTIYGGTYALFRNFLPKFNIKVKFVDITDLEAVKKACSKKTKMIYCESISNPLLEVSDLPKLSNISKSKNIPLVVDNTFSPMVISPAKLGANVVIHSLTKFINGSSDTLGGVICGSKEFLSQLIDVNSGASMLLGPVMDGMRASSILKNTHTLHLRMKQHSKNAFYLADKMEKAGLKVSYPGLKSHKDHELIKSMYNEEYGFSGLLTIDAVNH
jgi:methionine-gamma-lyase